MYSKERLYYERFINQILLEYMYMGKTLFVALTILLVLIFGVGGYFLFSYSSEPELVSSNSEPVLTCSDTDGNNIYQKGYSNYVYTDGSEGGIEDVCDYFHPKTKSKVGLARESYCDGNNLKTELWTCGGGFVCRNGACVKGKEDLALCSDTDGGKNINQRGSVYGLGGSGQDSCFNYSECSGEECYNAPECTGSECYVTEYYCDSDGNTIKSEQIKCQNGCGDGACF